MIKRLKAQTFGLTYLNKNKWTLPQQFSLNMFVQIVGEYLFCYTSVLCDMMKSFFFLRKGNYYYFMAIFFLGTVAKLKKVNLAFFSSCNQFLPRHPWP